MRGKKGSVDKKHLAVKYIIEELNQVYDDIDDDIREEYLKGALDILNEKEVAHE